MTYNAYIKQLPREKIAFLVEFEGLEFFSEVFKTILEVESIFANDIK